MEYQFGIDVNIHENQFQVDVYDDNEEWLAQTVGPDFGETLRHAVYILDPVLAAAAWHEHFEWTEDHKVDYE